MKKKRMADGLLKGLKQASNMENNKSLVVPLSQTMEDAAREWSKFSKGRKAQDFYEGALWCRTFILENNKK
jgi:hypothetical protein